MTRVKFTVGPTAGSTKVAAWHYGPTEIEDKHPSVYAVSQNRTVVSHTFSYDDLPVSGDDKLIAEIPANARITRSTLRVITPIAGTTPTLTIGLEQSDGTAIDVDGIDVAIAEAALDAIGETVECDGALVGNTAGIGTAAGQIIATTGGTVTAGKFMLETEYELLIDRA